MIERSAAAQLQHASLSVRAVKPVVAGLRALGHETDRLLADCGIDRAALERPDDRVGHAAMMGLWQRALEQSADDNIGLHVAEQTPLDALDLHAYALLASRDLRDGLLRGCRYQRLIHEATTLTLYEGDDEAVLQHSVPGGR